MKVYIMKACNDVLDLLEVKPTKKILGPKFGPNEPKSNPEIRFFPHFLKFGSLVFLEIACNDSLQQCLTSSRGITYEKKF